MAKQTTAKVELTNSTGNPRRFSVVDNFAISKGDLLSLEDARVASYAQSTTGLPAAGIATMDKTASDGSTSISVWTDGIFDLVASGALILGEPVLFVNDNYVKSALASSLSITAAGSLIVGYAMETATDAERVNIRIRI